MKRLKSNNFLLFLNFSLLYINLKNYPLIIGIYNGIYNYIRIYLTISLIYDNIYYIIFIKKVVKMKNKKDDYIVKLPSTLESN